MINCNQNITHFEGTPKELSFELTHILCGLKECLIKEYQIEEEDVNNILLECVKLSMMSNLERKEYLDELQTYKQLEYDFDRL